MKAMILAAGFGTRMLPFTKNKPKPILNIGGTTLIERHLINLKKIGVKEVIINLHYLASAIIETLGTGKKYNLKINYSYEEEILDTGGAIYKVLNQFDSKPFILVSADIYTDYSFSNLLDFDSDELSHLVLVKAPKLKPEGDFGLSKGRALIKSKEHFNYVYANMAVINPKLFQDRFLDKIRHSVLSDGSLKFPLGKLLQLAVEENLVTAELYNGTWENVGDFHCLHKVRCSMQRLAVV